MNFSNTIYTDLFSLIDAAAWSMASSLIPYSMNLLGILAGIVLVWEGLKSAIGGGVQNFLTTIFTLLITLSILVPLLLNWTNGPLSLPLAVLTMVEDLAMALGGNQSAVTAGMQHILGSMHELAQLSYAMQATPGGESGFWDKFDFTSFFKLFADIPNILLVGIASFLLSIMAALLIGVQIIGDIMLAVAMIVGPFLLAWSILPITSSLRDGLVKFAFNGVMLKLVGIILARIVGSAAKVFATNKLVNGGEPNFIALMVLIGLIVMLIYVLVQAQTLASALVSGGALDSPGGTLKRAVASSMSPQKGGKGKK